MSGGWTVAQASCRDQPDAGWSTAATSLRDGFSGPIYGGGAMAEMDCLGATGTVHNEAGWTVPVPGACRDG